MCRITQNTESSAFIFWYNDNRMINYDFDRGINVSTEAGKLHIFYKRKIRKCQAAHLAALIVILTFVFYNNIQKTIFNVIVELN